MLLLSTLPSSLPTVLLNAPLAVFGSTTAPLVLLITALFAFVVCLNFDESLNGEKSIVSPLPNFSL